MASYLNIETNLSNAYYFIDFCDKTMTEVISVLSMMFLGQDFVKLKIVLCLS